MMGVVVLWVAGSTSVSAQAPNSCEPLLSVAEERYVQREFAEAEALVRACLAQTDRADAEAVQSYRLLALIALRQDDGPGAERAVRQLLSVAPDYAPDPVQDPPAYVDLVAVVAERMRADPVLPADSIRAVPPVAEADLIEPEVEIVQTDPDRPPDPVPTAERAPRRERSGITRWLLIGGGVVVAGVAAVLLTAGGSSPPPSGGTPLPPPPPFPN
jgi:hypothetical protein